MTEQEALTESSGHIARPPYIGYLPLHAANLLVGSGNYVFEQATCWGYVIAQKPAGKPLTTPAPAATVHPAHVPRAKKQAEAPQEPPTTPHRGSR